MAQGTSADKEREYWELHAYLDYFSTHVRGIVPHDPVHPTNVGRDIVRDFGISKALAGLRQAIKDTIEETARLDADSVRRLDEALAERGIVTLSELRRRYWRKYRSLIDRGRIRSETEYYLAVGILNDMANAIAPEERARLQALVDSYETQSR
jgi:hypothetical protein